MTMRTFRKLGLAGVIGVSALCFGGQALAQDAGGPPGGPGGRFDPAQFRQMMMDRLKEQTGSTDEEWKTLEPLIQKVMDAQRESRGGFGFGMMRGPGGPGGPGGGRGPGGGNDDTAMGRAAAELRTANEDPNTNPQELARRIKAYREARDAAREKLAAAQKELRELLTQRQEAGLLMAGLVD
jgi:Spy/CpxP family protein refolding chaperone